MPAQREPQLKIRVPEDVKRWLEVQAARNRGSQASEIVRAVRDRMERMQKEEG